MVLERIKITLYFDDLRVVGEESKRKIRERSNMLFFVFSKKKETFHIGFFLN